MNKWLKKFGIGLIVLVVLGFIVLIGIAWMANEAFGTKYRTVQIQLNDEQTLICEE